MDEMAALRAENEALRQEAQALASSLQQASAGGILSLPVPGEFVLAMETPSGDWVEKSLRFLPGRVNCIIPKMKEAPKLAGATVPSAALLRIANGGSPAGQDAYNFPALASIDTATAQSILRHYATISAGFIELVDK